MPEFEKLKDQLAKTVQVLQEVKTKSAQALRDVDLLETSIQHSLISGTTLV